MRPLRNSPAAERLAQTVLADPSALRCDARRSRRELIRGGASSLGHGKECSSVGCNQRASALHRMAGLSQTSSAMRCASIAPYLGFRRSDFSPTPVQGQAAVGLKSDLQELRWSRVGKLLPTQSGGQRAAHPTQIYQAKVIAYPRISPVGHAEHRRSVRGSRRGLFERPQDASSAAAARFEKRRATRSAAEGVTSGSPSLGYVSWRDKKGTVPAGHPRHLNTRVSAQGHSAIQLCRCAPSPQPLPHQGGGAKSTPLQAALLLPRSPACKPIAERLAALLIKGGGHA